MTLIIFA